MFEDLGHVSLLTEFDEQAGTLTIVNGFINDDCYLKLKNIKYHKTVYACPLDIFKERVINVQRGFPNYVAYVLTRLSRHLLLGSRIQIL